MTVDMRVFISYKHHGPDGEELPEVAMASELHSELSRRGIPSFFSDRTVIDRARDDYKALIDESLDKADILVLVATEPEHCTGGWVQYECDSFFNDLLSRVKKGRFVSYLDNDDLRDFPRTVRANEIFQRKEDGLGKLLDFITNYLSEVAYGPAGDGDRGQSHYANTREEKDRLGVQATVGMKADRPHLDRIVASCDGVCRILDVGCAAGANTFGAFSRYGDSVKVIGIDRAEEWVEEFNRESPGDNMSAHVLVLGTDGWLSGLRKIMEEEDAPSFDLVYCALSLHHMPSSGDIVAELRKVMSPGGRIYIRTSDDALKISYPHHEIVRDIIETTASLPHIADRYHGRKVYGHLLRAGFTDIRIITPLVDTIGMEGEERTALFQTTFTWRKQYFEHQVDIAPDERERKRAVKALEEFSAKVDRIEELFSDPEYYFGYYITIAIATNKKDE